MYEGLDQFLKMNKSIVDPISDINRNANEVFRRAAQQNFKLISENLELVADQFRRLSLVQKPEEFMSLARDCISEDATATMKNLEKVLHFSMDRMDELSKLYGTALREPIHAGFKTAEKARKKAEKFATEK